MTTTTEAAGESRGGMSVSGMTCAACQARVQRTLNRTAGVADATVNLMLNNATIANDPAAISPEQLVEAIRESGYGAELPAPSHGAFDEQEDAEHAHQEEVRVLTRKVAVSLTLAVVAMVLSMSAMGEGSTG